MTVKTVLPEMTQGCKRAERSGVKLFKVKFATIVLNYGGSKN